MDHHVLFADGRKTVARVFAYAFREARVVGLEAQILARRLGDFRKRIQRQQARQYRDAIFGNAEFLHDELTQRSRHFGIGLDTDHRPATAALEGRLEKAHEVFGFLLDFDVAVSNDAERARPLHLVAGEKPVDELADDVFEGDVADDVLDVRQANEAIERHG